MGKDTCEKQRKYDNCCKKNSTIVCTLFTVLHEQIISIKIANELQVDEIQGENEDPVDDNIDGILQ